MFMGAIIITGYGARTNVAIIPDAGIAQIAEMPCFDPFAKRRGF
jgi:hypothetical protein